MPLPAKLGGLKVVSITCAQDRSHFYWSDNGHSYSLLRTSDRTYELYTDGVPAGITVGQPDQDGEWIAFDPTGLGISAHECVIQAAMKALELAE